MTAKHLTDRAVNALARHPAPADLTEQKREKVSRGYPTGDCGRLGPRPVIEIDPRDVIDLVKRIKDRGAPHQARNVLGYCRRFFTWVVAQHVNGSLICGTATVGDDADRDKATHLLEIVGVRGASFVQDDVWESYEDRLRGRAARLVQKHRRARERLAALLLERKTMTAAEIDSAIAG